MDLEKLVALKDRVEKAQKKLYELEGKRKQVLASLKTEFDCNDLAEAKNKANKMHLQIKDMQEKCEVSVAEMNDKYNLDLK